MAMREQLPDGSIRLSGGATPLATGPWLPYNTVWNSNGFGVQSPGDSGGMSAFYHRIENTVNYKIILRLGNGSWGSGYWTFSLPFTMVSINMWGPAVMPMGSGMIYDDGNTYRPVFPLALSTTTVSAMADAAGVALVGQGSPMTFVWGDALVMTGAYEALSL